jgi:hypothetical protein
LGKKVYDLEDDEEGEQEIIFRRIWSMDFISVSVPCVVIYSGYEKRCDLWFEKI